MDKRFKVYELMDLKKEILKRKAKLLKLREDVLNKFDIDIERLIDFNELEIFHNKMIRREDFAMSNISRNVPDKSFRDDALVLDRLISLTVHIRSKMFQDDRLRDFTINRVHTDL